MTAIEVTAAAVIAGIAMAALTEIGYRMRLVKANLLMIDGEFALTRLRLKTGKAMVYAAGIAVHLVTSAVFGAVYYGIALLFDIDPANIIALAPYVFLLWLAMLFFALPAAGQGILGRRAAASAWYEQLALHAVFGVVLWAALGIF